MIPSKPKRCVICDKIIRCWNKSELCSYHSQNNKIKIRIKNKKIKENTEDYLRNKILIIQ